MDINYQFPSTDYAQNIYWVYSIVAPDEEQKQLCIEYLKQHKIGTRPFFACMHNQPVFKKMGLLQNEAHPVAEKLSSRGFYIPSGLALTDEDLAAVIGAFKSFFIKVRTIVIYLVLLGQLNKENFISVF